MSEAPPPPQVSPDGKFYWDGQRWVPIPQAALPSQPGPMPQSPIQLAAPTKKVGDTESCVMRGCLALLVVVGGVIVLFVIVEVLGVGR